MGKSALLLLTIVAVGAAAAYAKQEDAIAQRQAIMKGQGKAFLGDLNKMRKGQIPYDQAHVDATFTKIVGNAKVLPTLFPDNSKTGEKTRALPKIWSNKADLDSRFKKLGDDAAAAKASVKNLATLKVAFDTVNGDCGGCHKLYRAPSD